MWTMNTMKLNTRLFRSENNFRRIRNFLSGASGRLIKFKKRMKYLPLDSVRSTFAKPMLCHLAIDKNGMITNNINVRSGINQ